jgi:hypothetical protein
MRGRYHGNLADRERDLTTFIQGRPNADRQNPCREPVIGTLRRDCVEHVIVIGEQHLRRILWKYLKGYHGSRTHLALGKGGRQQVAGRNRRHAGATS